jgi:hypothetical protein
MFCVKYTPPSFAPRIAAELPRAARQAESLSLSRIHNTDAMPRSSARMANYRAFTRSYTPAGPEAGSRPWMIAEKAGPTVPVPATLSAARKFCAFTGIPLRNGLLDVTSRPSVHRASAAFQTGSRAPTVVGLRAPEMRPFFSMFTAENKTQPRPSAASVVSSAGSAAACSRGQGTAQRSGDEVLNDIGALRKKWQDGYFASSASQTSAMQDSADRVHRIRAEIAQARNSRT